MKIWVTRTEPGATALAEAMVAGGHDILKAPVLEIRPQAFDPPEGQFDFGLFLSVHGARIAAAGLRGQVAELFAVGRQTQATLSALGFEAALPATETSEGLLHALPDVSGKRILIVTGAGGRTLLPDALQDRGAEVRRLDAYLRYPLTPNVDAAGIDAIVVSSGGGFRQAAAVWRTAGGSPDVPVLAPSERVAALGASLGMGSVQDCGGAGAEAVLRTLRRLGVEDRRG